MLIAPTSCITPRQHYIAGLQRLQEATAVTFELNSGEALYLPGGWAHEVESVGLNIAVTLWSDWDGREMPIGEQNATQMHNASTTTSTNAKCKCNCKGKAKAKMQNAKCKIQASANCNTQERRFVKSLVLRDSKPTVSVQHCSCDQSVRSPPHKYPSTHTWLLSRFSPSCRSAASPDMQHNNQCTVNKNNIRFF